MTNKIDLLSESIDKLNSGQTPHPADTETADLLEVAALLQKSELSAQPPEHILSATVQSAVDGLAKQSSRRRNSWMYSGILGAAAAFLLFIGIHGFPDIQEVAPIVSPPPQTASSPVTPEKPTLRSAAPPPAIANPPADSPPTAKPEVPAPKPAPAPSAAPKIAAPAQPEHTPASPQPRLYKSAPAPAAKPALASQLAAVVLPGRSPESVSFDRDAGILRQVFARGTSQELTITQRGSASTEPLTTDHNKSVGQTGIYAEKADKALPFNKLVILWNGQQITLEGPQSVQELTTIAELIRAANPEKKKP